MAKMNFPGDSTCFGYHTDLHLWMGDRGAGDHALPDELEKSLRIVNPDWVQVDSKGHPGVASFFSKVPDATVCDTLSHDAVAAWREAADRLNLPLICHYSGFIDMSAARKHPEWRVVPAQDDGWTPESDHWYLCAMCPRSEYWDKLMIPQLLELLKVYRADGFWIDGDAWGFHGCWCPKCRAEFTRRTGIAEIPRNPGDPHHGEWWQFQFDSVTETIKKYTAAVHAADPDAKICSNWFDSLKYPLVGKNADIGLDWLSGDALPIFPLDDQILNLRTEALWIANRGKSWDLMSWPQLGSPNYYPKPVDMLCQEAAHVVAAGGRYLFCEGGGGIRTSQQIDWRLKRLAKVGDFVRERAPFCRGAEPVHEVALLYSENTPFCTPNSVARETATVNPAMDCLTGCLYNVDILNEEALLPKIGTFKAVVLAQNLPLASQAVEGMKDYVEHGGALLICGVETMKSFGLDYLGIREMETETKCPYAGMPWSFVEKKDDTPLYFLSDSDDGVFPVTSAQWGLLKKLDPAAQPLEHIFDNYIRENSRVDLPAAVMTRHGRGSVIALPCDYFAAYANHYYLPEARKFAGRLMKRLIPLRDIEVEAPSVIDVIFRKKDGRLLVHLINRSTGSATSPGKKAIDEIPPVGPVTLTFRLSKAPAQALLLPENTPLEIRWDEATKTAVVRVPSVRIHSAVALSAAE